MPLVKPPLPLGVMRYSRPHADVQVPRYFSIFPFVPESTAVGKVACGVFRTLSSVAQPPDANTASDAITKVLAKGTVNSREKII